MSHNPNKFTTAFSGKSERGGGSVKVMGATKAYASLKALDDVSLEVRAGEFFALLGPSGSGKTTLLMTIAGFSVPDAGHIFVDDRDITKLATDKRNLGMVFQRYALFPHMTLTDNIGFPLRMRGVAAPERNARAEEALATVGLAGFGSRLPAQLSGGQQQRVALARAIVYTPSVLLMDEPLSALDKNLRERMRFEIKRLQKQLGVTVIFVTHDQEEALVLADRIAVMDKGRIVQIGTPRELYGKPENPFVAAFLGETNFLDGKFEQVGGASSVLLEDGVSARGVPSEDHLSQGRKARLSVRPESIKISLNREKELISGNICEVTYAGSSTIYLVDIGGGNRLTVRKPSTGDAASLSSGDDVFLGWEVEDARIFAFAD